jgi:DNA-nicking Smr family endonuclease
VRSWSEHDDERDDEPEVESIDLHGLTVEQALRRVAQELHAARVRRLVRVIVVTGAGWGSPGQKPVLLPRVEAWLRGPEARALGVRDVRRARGGGALDVRLG